MEGNDEDSDVDVGGENCLGGNTIDEELTLAKEIADFNKQDV